MNHDRIRMNIACFSHDLRQDRICSLSVLHICSEHFHSTVFRQSHSSSRRQTHFPASREATAVEKERNAYSFSSIALCRIECGEISTLRIEVRFLKRAIQEASQINIFFYDLSCRHTVALT